MAASLTAHLKLARNGFTAGLKSAGKDLTKFANETKDAAFAATKTGLLGVAAGGMAAAVGLIAGVKSAYDLGGSLNDLRDRTGIAAGRLLILRQAFEDNGIAADDVGSSINKMQKFIGAARDSASPAAKVMAGLGLSLSDIENMTPDKQFEAIGSAINGVSDATTKSTASMSVFGKSGGKFLALFGDTGAIKTAAMSLGKQADILDKSSGTFDAISDKLERSGKKLQGFFVGVASVLAATIGPLLDRFDKTDFADVGIKFGASLLAGADTLLGAFRNPAAALSVFQLYLDGVMASGGNALYNGLRKSLAFLQGGFVTAIQGLGRILLGSLMEAFAQPLAFFQASVEETIARMSPKNLKDSAELAGTNHALDYQRRQLGTATARGDHKGVSDAMDQINKLTADANAIEDRMKGPSVEDRMKKILAAGGPSISMGNEGRLTAADLTASGKTMLSSGIANASSAASALPSQDLFGAKPAFDKAEKQRVALQSSGNQVRTAAIATPKAKPRNAYEAQLFETLGPDAAAKVISEQDDKKAEEAKIPAPRNAHEAQLYSILGKSAGAKAVAAEEAKKNGGKQQDTTAKQSITLQETMSKNIESLLNVTKNAFDN